MMLHRQWLDIHQLLHLLTILHQEIIHLSILILEHKPVDSFKFSFHVTSSVFTYRGIYFQRQFPHWLGDKRW